jgi:hypothetical protein
MTETAITYVETSRALHPRSGSVGRPLSNVPTVITEGTANGRNADQGELAATPAVGGREVVAPAMDARAGFPPATWCGWRRAAGVRGGPREGRVFTVSGENVYPDEVEDDLRPTASRADEGWACRRTAKPAPSGDRLVMYMGDKAGDRFTSRDCAPDRADQREAQRVMQVGRVLVSEEKMPWSTPSRF